MRFHEPKTEFYCGVDLHAKIMHLCIINRDGQVLLRRKLRTEPAGFLQAIEAYRHNLTVAVESLYCYYWLADLCAEEEVCFALGHALYMKAVHGGKTKNDPLDAEKIARLTAGGLLPVAYVYPREYRGARDLLRRRLRFVRMRAELYSHIQKLHHQANLPSPGPDVKRRGKRAALSRAFDDPAVQSSLEADLETIAHLDWLIRGLERSLLQFAEQAFPRERSILQSIPGVGPILSLTILLEIGSVERFATRQQFASYCRLVKPARESAGKKSAPKGQKMGNPYLKWAFSEMAVSAAQHDASIERHLNRLQSRHGKHKSKTLLAHKLGRTVYQMLKRKVAFDPQRFLRG